MSYKLHLQKDKKLAKILTDTHHQLALYKNIPLRIMQSILGQQLSTKVAAVIYNRFIKLYNGKEPKPQQVIDTEDEVLRGIGLSYAKIIYVKAVAQFCIDNKVTDKKLQKMPDAEIMELLIQIKGVGKWTVEMLLMFSLGREDIFSIDDLGIQQGMIKAYKLDTTDKKKFREKLLQISDKWSPYRTYACLHIWEWKDSK